MSIDRGMKAGTEHLDLDAGSIETKSGRRSYHTYPEEEPHKCMGIPLPYRGPTQSAFEEASASQPAAEDSNPLTAVERADGPDSSMPVLEGVL